MFDHIRADLAIIRERDPAARGWLEIVCCYPGFQAISLHRISHRLWTCRLPLKLAARCLSQSAVPSPASRSTPAPASATACSSTTAWGW